MKKSILLTIVITLCLAFGIQAYAWLRPQPESRLDKKLAELLPQGSQGWSSVDMPLGNTEAVVERSNALLNFDDYVFRSYRRGNQEFQVYVAYWGPGKMPVRLVNAHTPDRCWSQTGWQCTDMRFRQPARSPQGDLLPMEWRVFAMDGQRLYVHYWHIVGNEIHNYGHGFNQAPPVTVVFQDILKYGLNLKREQFFVRITSGQPLENFEKDPMYVEVLQSLGQLCLLETEK